MTEIKFIKYLEELLKNYKLDAGLLAFIILFGILIKSIFHPPSKLMPIIIFGLSGLVNITQIIGYKIFWAEWPGIIGKYGLLSLGLYGLLVVYIPKIKEKLSRKNKD